MGLRVLNLCQNTSNSFLLYIIDENAHCTVKEKTLAICPKLDSRESCLTSRDSRNYPINNVQLYGTDCAWCPNGPCMWAVNNQRCQPIDWLIKTTEVRAIETCLNVDIKGEL